MCQSRAEGGRRCLSHLTATASKHLQAVDTAHANYMKAFHSGDMDARMAAQAKLRSAKNDAAPHIDEMVRRGPAGVLALRDLEQQSTSVSGRDSARDAWESAYKVDSPDWEPTVHYTDNDNTAIVIDAPGPKAAVLTRGGDSTWTGTDAWGFAHQGSRENVINSVSYDDNGDRYPDSCNCDIDGSCTNPKCVADRDAEMRSFEAEFRREAAHLSSVRDYVSSVSYRDDPMGHESAKQVLGEDGYRAAM